MIKINQKFEQILLGSLLGDGCLHIRKGRKTPKYVEDHSGLQKEALRHKIYYFKNRDKILAKNHDYYKLQKLEKIIEFGK